MMKNRITTLLTLMLLTGCSTASKNQRIVNVENWPTTPPIQTASSVSNHVLQTSTHTTASPEQAKTVCETHAMRQNVVDYDDSNDSVRIMTVQDSTNDSRVLSEVAVDCRDYFLRKSLSPNAQLLKASTVTDGNQIQPRRSTRIQNTANDYLVKSGDTVWGIAREHCTTAKAISLLNGLGKGNLIDIGQHLKLPNEACD